MQAWITTYSMIVARKSTKWEDFCPVFVERLASREMFFNSPKEYSLDKTLPTMEVWFETITEKHGYPMIEGFILGTHKGNENPIEDDQLESHIHHFLEERTMVADKVMFIKEWHLDNQETEKIWEF